MVSTFLWARDWKWPMNNNYQFQLNISLARSNKQLLHCSIMDKSLGTLLHFGGIFQFTHAHPLASRHKQCWTRVSRIFTEFRLCIGWGEGELREKFEKDALFCEGTQILQKIMNTTLLSLGLLSKIGWLFVFYLVFLHVYVPFEVLRKYNLFEQMVPSHECFKLPWVTREIMSASLAQWLEHWSRKPGVESSNLSRGS